MAALIWLNDSVAYPIKVDPVLTLKVTSKAMESVHSSLSSLCKRGTEFVSTLSDIVFD